jgi:hypothetical protein
MPLRGPRGVDLLQGETIVLFASAARGASAGTNGTPVVVNGERPRHVFLLDTSAAATEGTDTLDVYIDVLAGDGVTWLNAIHFPQLIGTGGAKKYWAVLDPSAPGTACVDVTTDAAVNTVRPSLFGPQVRGRYVEVDGGGAASSFTFQLVGYAAGHNI